jgi:alkylhydroperoxidase family enzyme
MNAHAATARHLLGSERGLVDQVIADPQQAPIDAKMKALLAIADKVRQGGRRVTDDDIARARKEGADDNAIHHAVLVAAAFCMYNRYVDGLATSTPTDPSLYAQVGAHLAETGYLRPVTA